MMLRQAKRERKRKRDENRQAAALCPHQMDEEAFISNQNISQGIAMAGDGVHLLLCTVSPFLLSHAHTGGD